MAVVIRDNPRVIPRGMDVYFVWKLQEKDGTVPDLSTWSATFEIFDVAGVSQYRWESAGGYINVGRWDSLTIYGFYNVYFGLPHEDAGELIDWGLGSFNCDLIDPMGHVSYRIEGPISVAKGSTHA